MSLKGNKSLPRPMPRPSERERQQVLHAAKQCQDIMPPQAKTLICPPRIRPPKIINADKVPTTSTSSGGPGPNHDDDCQDKMASDETPKATMEGLPVHGSQEHAALLDRIVGSTANAAAVAAAEAVGRNMLQAMMPHPPAAAAAAAEAITQMASGSFTRTMLQVMTPPPPPQAARQEQEAIGVLCETRRCDRYDTFKCGNMTIKDDEGWVKSRKGWNKLCPECKHALLEQQELRPMHSKNRRKIGVIDGVKTPLLFLLMCDGRFDVKTTRVK